MKRSTLGAGPSKLAIHPRRDLVSPRVHREKRVQRRSLLVVGIDPAQVEFRQLGATEVASRHRDVYAAHRRFLEGERTSRFDEGSLSVLGAPGRHEGRPTEAGRDNTTQPH